MSIIAVSSINENQNTIKDIGINKIKITSGLPKSSISSSPRKSIWTIIGMMFVGLMYLLIAVTNNGPITRSYYIYSIMFALVIIGTISILSVSIAEEGLRLKVHENMMKYAIVSVLAVGVLSNITIWIITAINQVYSDLMLCVMFTHSLFVISFIYLLIDHKIKMKRIQS